MQMLKQLYCRFCAEKKYFPENVDLNLDIQKRLVVMEKLSFFMFDYVDFSDKSLPNTICISCYDSLSSAHDFFNKIKIAQVTLKNLKHECKEISSEENSVTDRKLNLEPYSEIQTPVHEYDAIVNSEESIIEHHSLSALDNNNCVSDFADQEFKLDIKQNIDFIPSMSDVDCKSDYNDETWHDYPWTCKYCKTTFTNIATLRQHCKDVHGTCFGLKCVDCRTCVSNFDMFVQHVQKHRKRLIDFCQYCNIKIDPEQSIHHLSTHISQPHCSACGETFQNYPLLEHHLLLYQPASKIIRNRRSSSQESLKVFLKDSDLIKSDTEDGTWQEYPWICQFCDMQLPNLNTLRKHVKEYHGKCFGLSCADCKTHFNGFKEFVEHVRCHRSNLKHYCQYCNYKFDSPTQSIIHITSHLIEQVSCETCGELFQCDSDLQDHLKTYALTKRSVFKRRGAPVTIEDLTCNICHKVAKSLNNLRMHKKLHTNRCRDHTCDRCGKAFFTKGTLNAHILIHEQPDPQICKICKKSFLTLTRLKKHVKTHYAEKPFQCSDCQRCFRLKDQLKSHMIIHSNLAPYKCQYCEKKFKHRNVMKIHENQHTGARPYVCELCSMAFSNWSNCNKHMKRKHSMTIAKNIRTPQGPVPINPTTGKPKKLQDIEVVRDWTEKIMVPCKRGKKSDRLKTSFLSTGDDDLTTNLTSNIAE